MSAFDRLRDVFKLPQFETEEENRVAGIFRAISVVTLLGLGVVIIQRILAHDLSSLPVMSTVFVLVVASIVLSQFRYLNSASGLYLWSILGFIMYMSARYDGTHDTVVLAVPGVIVAGGLILRRRHFTLYALAAILCVVGTAAAEMYGILNNPFSEKTRFEDIVSLSVILGVTAIAIRLLSDNLNKNFSRALASEQAATNHLERLRASELRYRTLFESANDAIFIMKNGRFVECNSMAVRMFGCGVASDMIDHYPWEFSPSRQPDGADSAEKAQAIIGNALGGRPQRFYWKHARKDGSEFDAEVSLKSLNLGQETVVQAMVTDITERRKAEEALRKSEETFYKIFHASPVPMSISTLGTGRYVDANESFLKYMEFAREDLIGKTALELNTWDDPEERKTIAERLLHEGAIHNHEGRYRTKTGKIGYSIISAETIDIDGQPHILGVSVDITDRKRAEEALHLQISALESADNSIVITDKTGAIQWANQAFSRMTGFSIGEVLGKNPRMFKSGRQDRSFYEAMWKTILSGEAWHGEIINRKKDGSEYDEELTITPVKTGDGEIGNFIAVKQDISERKRAEEVLKRYELISENARDTILLIRLSDQRIMEVNRAAQSMYGYTREELLSLHLQNLISPGVITDLPTLVTKADREGIFLQTIHRRKDGTTFPVEVSSTGADILGNRFLVSIIRDVSERKRVEDALKESEQLHRAIFALSPGGIILTDIDGRILEVNTAATIQNGYSSDELVGKNVRILTRREDEPNVERNITQLRAGKTLQHEVVNVRKDGTLCDIELRETVISLPNGKQGILSITSDISDRKRSETLLKESEARFRAVVENSYDAVLFADEKGVITYISPSFQRITGYTKEEREGRSVFELVHPDDAAFVKEMISGVLQSEDVAKLQYRLIHKDGTIRWSEATVHNLLGDPNVKAVVANVRDITESKNAEEALRESERRYRNLVEISPDAVVIHQDFSVVFANPAAASLMGMVTKDELIGRSIFEVVPKHQFDLVRERNRQMLTENKTLPFTEFKLQRPNGTSVDVETKAIPTVWQGKPAAQVVIHDLSERKKAEASLQESEERFRSLSRVTFEGIMIHEDGVIIDANQRFAELFGFPGPDTLIGKRGLEILPFSSESRERIRKSLETRSDSPFEIEVVRPDGTIFPAETQSRRTMYRGQLASVVTMRDISDRKIAEKALAESEERFRALVQNSSDVITVVDASGTIRYMSPSVARILKYQQEDLVGRNVFEFIHPDDLEIVRKDFTAMVNSRADNIPTEFRFRNPEGDWRHVESVSTDLTNNPFVGGFVINTRDVSERKKVEAALKESEERFRLLVENSAELIAELDTEGSFVYVSPNCKRILGMKPSDLVGKNAFALVHPGDLQRVMGKFQSEHASDVYRYQHKDGSWKWLESSGQRFKTSSAEERIVVISRDITERKASEEELNRSRTRLQRFSEHLENVLDEERKRISREIHDELGQTLTVLKFDLSWFTLKSRSRSKEFSDKIKEMTATVGEALASVKRISRELRPPQLAALGLIGAIQLDVNQIEKKAGIHAQIRILPPDFEVEGQLSMTIYRVFNEILTNVVRHADAKHVQILLTKTSGSLDLEVHDDGRGITRKEIEGDLSLGLVGMKERVRQWNGRLSIQGEKGKGTTVTVHFPLTQPSSEGSTP